MSSYSSLCTWYMSLKAFPIPICRQHRPKLVPFTIHTHCVCETIFHFCYSQNYEWDKTQALIETQNKLYPIYRTKQCRAYECNNIIYDLWAHDETWKSWTMLLLNISSSLLFLCNSFQFHTFSFFHFSHFYKENFFFLCVPNR